MKYFALLLLTSIGCGTFKYSHQVDFNPKNHSYSNSEINDSSLISNRTNILLKSDSTVSGVILGISENGILVKKQGKQGDIQVPFNRISSFETSGFQTAFYNRNSFGYGTALAFLFLTIPEIAGGGIEKTKTVGDTSLKVTGYIGISLLAGYFTAKLVESSDEEKKSGIVKVTVIE